jgi:hypothetical protein
MANILKREKQIVIVGSLAEGSSIRSIERLTGVHRDTIMRLGVRIHPLNFPFFLKIQIRTLPKNLRLQTFCQYVLVKIIHIFLYFSIDI